MPVKEGKDKDGCYAKWGEQGFKYYYDCNNEGSKRNARKKAVAQGIASGDINIK